MKGWYWSSFCKTQYASSPAAGGVPNFLHCHLSVIRLLDHAKQLGILASVSDEGDYWEKRDVKALVQEVGEWNEGMAGLVGQMKDLFGDTALMHQSGNFRTLNIWKRGGGRARSRDSRSCEPIAAIAVTDSHEYDSYERQIAMWIFGKSGHLSIGQHSSDHGYLVVHAQVREDIENLVAMLDEAGVGRHEIQETVEGDYRFLVIARRSAVVDAVAKMVSGIDYGKSCARLPCGLRGKARLPAVVESHRAANRHGAGVTTFHEMCIL